MIEPKQETEPKLEEVELEIIGEKKPSKLNKVSAFLVRSLVVLIILFGSIIAAAYLYISPSLPSIQSLKDIRYQVPLRIYSADNKLMGEFGEKRRIPLRYQQIPREMVQAILGAEDDRFFEHPGVDYQGLLRAAKVMATTGKKAQGGSTITMQVARNFFLSREKTFLRKFSEIFLALQIEQELNKEDILALYLNKIYLGNRAYGVGAAAWIYYGKDISKLSIAEMAMIAGLPKAPSRYNPIVNPKRALLRRDYVLRRMYELNYINERSFNIEIARPVTAKIRPQNIELEAPYAAEMVRKEMIERYGKEAYTGGYKVYTQINSRLQAKANDAVRYNLLAYEERHGYRGAEEHLDILRYSTPQEWDTELKKVKKYPLLKAGVVIEVNDDSIVTYLKDGKRVTVDWRGLKWAAPYINGNIVGKKPKNAHQILSKGDVVRLYDAGSGRWSLGQLPTVSGALVSLNVKNGGIESIVGGYNFYRSKFNRATQAKRQPGSNFKPFVYSAALEKGYTAATLINDAPVVFNDSGLEEAWRPENYSGKIFGPTRFRQALIKSRNLVSIRILRSIGVKYAIDYVQRFGFNSAELPRDLSLALGSASMTPLEIARAYASLANGGYLIEPHMIDRILDVNDDLLYKANPPTVCPECEEPRITDIFNNNLPPINVASRIASAENVYIMTTILRDIITRGTGRRAKVLKRTDLAGKTGTTNDQRDAWFSGFNADIATTAWVGFDDSTPLGDRETGARAALPMWIRYMREALRDLPEKPLVRPAGIVTVRIDPKSGLLAGSHFPKAIFESFRINNVPKQMTEDTFSSKKGDKEEPLEVLEELF